MALLDGARMVATRHVAALAALATLTTVAACGVDLPPSPLDAPLPPAAPVHTWAPSPAGELPVFVDVASQSDLGKFHLHAGVRPPQNWLIEVVPGGAAALDYDGDGDLDILLVDGSDVAEDGQLVVADGQGTRLYRNDGHLHFTDVTAAAGIDLQGHGICCAAADYDEDGDVDIAVAGLDFCALLRNRGDGTFEEIAVDVGVRPIDGNHTTGLAWGDLDGDGRLDLFVSNYVDHWQEVDKVARHGGTSRTCRWRDEPIYCGPSGMPPQRNQLFLQTQPGCFEEARAERLASTPSYSYQPLLTDVDRDGDLDVFIPNDGKDNELLLNDGRAHFQEFGLLSGVATNGLYRMQASMGVDAADYDRDGRLDLFVTNFALEHNTLYRNLTSAPGRPSFDDVTRSTRISRVPQHRLCWGTKLLDYDNDGVLDAFCAAGHVYIVTENAPHGHIGYSQRNQVVRGLGPPDYRFEDVTDLSGPGLDEARAWRGAVFADFDDDGDWDVLVTALHSPPALLRNDGGNRNRWVRFDLRTQAGGRSPAGARIEVWVDAATALIDELHCGSSYACSNDPRALIGVGALQVVPEVHIRWPGGGVTTLRDVATNQTHVVQQE